MGALGRGPPRPSHLARNELGDSRGRRPTTEPDTISELHGFTQLLLPKKRCRMPGSDSDDGSRMSFAVSSSIDAAKPVCRAPFSGVPAFMRSLAVVWSR